jgi:outer membrane lipoprotein SlyB
MKVLNIKIIAVVAATLFLSACATDISSNSYSDQHVGEAAHSYYATVAKVRKVKVGPDELGKSKTGAVVGGVGGALVGSTMGSGTGKLLMTAGGVVAGAVGGAYAERAMKTQTGLEITVQMKNGELLTVVQGADVQFSKGEKVLVIVYKKGRSKIVKETA